MSVEALKSFFDIGTVILLFLTFAFGAGVLVTGSIINSRQDKQLRQFDKDLTDAKTELGKQQERAALAERSLLQLKESLKDRELSDAQFDALVESLKPFAGQEFDVIAFWDNAESVSIGNRVVSALRKSGWIRIDPGYHAAFLGGLVGIKVTVEQNSDAKTKKAANLLALSLSKQGLATIENEEETINPRQNKIQIEVGTKR